MGGKGGIFMTEKRSDIYRICLDAMFVAIYVLLATVLTVKTPVLEISWASLPILLCAFLFSPVDALTVALCGSFLEQVFSQYGLMATTPVWMAPIVLQAAIASFLAWIFCRKEWKVWKAVVIIVISEVFLTAANAGALVFDAYIFDYLAYLSIDIPMRLLNGGIRTALSCVAIPLIVPQLKRILKKRAR